MNNRIMKKSVGCIMVAVIMVVGVVATPFRAFAEFEEEELPLINTSTAEIRNAWMQLKNAAIIHLVAQKMKVCTENGHVLKEGNTLPRETESLFLFVGKENGVIDKGSVFNWTIMGGDFRNNIGVGPWMSSLFKGQSDGIIECNDWTGEKDGNLFNMFAYILKYEAGMTEFDLENISVDEGDRMKLVCDIDDPTQPGLLASSDENADCNSASEYTGRDASDQTEYLKKVYDRILNKEKTGNRYILSWDELDEYNHVDGYYLYSKDLDKQCESSKSKQVEFVEDKGDDIGTYIDGYRINNEDGTIRKGFYKIYPYVDISGGTVPSTGATQSFVNGTKTCKDLVIRMNELVGEYIQRVNLEIFRACRDGIIEAIEGKEQELNEKYLNDETSTDEEKKSARDILGEYERIKRYYEYVVKEGEDGGMELVQVEKQSESDMPDDYIWTCRASLPKINVEIQEEGAVDDALEEAFKDPCYEAVDLAWVVCPVINALAGTVDGLTSLIEGFFR